MLLVAHYDGIPAGPSAADDAAGVAALLETLRARRAGPPLRNDVIALLPNDTDAGHEQAGRRPALVISPGRYNGKVGLAILCPITAHVKGYPFEVRIPESHEVVGVVLSDQVKRLDWRARRAEFADRLPEAVTAEVLGKLATLVRLP
ncbi:MAG: type II toxin-antitoxin system PemK/MazF family toxin [Gemmatimonadetes bacterium]|nr:type II toxin-antitoxin system PemK/MazF family toxin [Gemmatimonadota bacterium]